MAAAVSPPAKQHDALGEVRRTDSSSLLPSAQFFKQMGVSRDAIGASSTARRHATHAGSDSAPPPDFEQQLRQFERRRGANHIQIFLEEAISEIMEGGGASRCVQRLTHVRRLLDDVLAQVQKVAQKMAKAGGGRDIKAMTRLRASFLMLSRADRSVGDAAEGGTAAGAGARTSMRTGSDQNDSNKRRAKPAASASPPEMPRPASSSGAGDDDGAEEAERRQELEAEVAGLRRRLQSTLRRLQKTEHTVQGRDQTIRTLQDELAGREAAAIGQGRHLQTAQLALAKAKSEIMAERARNPGRSSAGAGDALAVSSEVAAANAVEAKRQAEWAALKEEQGRRAMLLGEQERSIAKLTERCKSLELKNRQLVARQDQIEKTAAEAFDAAGGQELRNDAADKKVANLRIKLREQEAALQFVMEQLELRERDVAELRVTGQIAEEKRARAESRLQYHLSSRKYSGSCLICS
eukprot:SAG22_NODE_1720_length_3725_cov_2.431054_2_plen_466_part_00